MIGMKQQDGKRVPNCVPTEDTSADREWGTSSLVRAYKRATPGEDRQMEDVGPANDPNDSVTLTSKPAKYSLSGSNVDAWTRETVATKDADMDEHIEKVDGKYRLVSKKTGKNLGTYDTKAAAEKRERQVQFFKHQHEAATLPSFKDFMAEDKYQTPAEKAMADWERQAQQAIHPHGNLQGAELMAAIAKGFSKPTVYKPLKPLFKKNHDDDDDSSNGSGGGFFGGGRSGGGGKSGHW